MVCVFGFVTSCICVFLFPAELDVDSLSSRLFALLPSEQESPFSSHSYKSEGEVFPFFLL